MYKLIVFLALFIQVSLATEDEINKSMPSLVPVDGIYDRPSIIRMRNYFNKIASKCKYDQIMPTISYNLFTNGNGEFQKLNNQSRCPHPSKPLKMIIHGWTNSATRPWVLDMGKTYFKKGGFNVIAVDWAQPASTLNYFKAAANTQCVGYIIGDFIIKYLNGQCQMPFSQMHIIGHSLGAHLAGFVGKYVGAFSISGKIGRISGLDMAGMCFQDTKPDNRLYEGDATLVDVYHTDDAVGTLDRVGNYDFYINDGVAPQPGCLDNILQSWHDFLQGIYHCSHGRVHEYFTESITSDNFIAFKCEKHWNNFKITGPSKVMGEGLTDTGHYGSYCIETHSKPPFAISPKKLKIFG